MRQKILFGETCPHQQDIHAQLGFIPVPQAHGSEDFIAHESSSINILNSLVVPRPIAFVTTRGVNGVVNAAPFSYFNIACTHPTIVSIAIEHRRGSRKDTACNIIATKEFVVNICSLGLAHFVNFAAGNFLPEVSEVELARLSLIPSHKVSVPRIANTLAQLECVLHQVITIGKKPAELMLGEVVKVHVHKDILNSRGQVDIEKLNPLVRLGGMSYAQLSAIFDLSKDD